MKTKEAWSWLAVAGQAVVLAGLVCGVLVATPGFGQETTSPASAIPVVPGSPVAVTNLVTINVENGPMTQVLNAFSRQTGRSIVIGPEVTGNVTLRVADMPWKDALDVILKPYGYGYYMVGETIIICGIEKLPKPAEEGTPAAGPAVGATAGAPAAAPGAKPAGPPPKPPEPPLLVKVFTLKYLDAADVEGLVKAQLSPRGRIGRLLTRSQSWQDQQIFQGSLNTTSSESLGRLKRLQEDPNQVRGKTLVVVDNQDTIDRVQEMLGKVDVMPVQIQIRARFIEVRADLLRDLGVEWGTGVNGASSPGVTTLGTRGASSLYAAGGQQINGTVKPAAFDSQSLLSAKRPFDGGLSLAFQKLTDLQLEVLLHLLQEDNSYNMLSSPQVLTMDNQDAVIIVGQKLPIIKSDSSGTLGTTTISTTLERYEDIGIKLKVMPQVCDSSFINLIVHPSVRELLGYQSGKVTSLAGAAVALTEYPVIATREAESQVMVKSGQTIVIGGMLRDKQVTTQIKTPFLGSIPLLGALFRRETVTTEKLELLIFLTATIRSTVEELAVVEPAAKPVIKVEAAAEKVNP